MSPCSRMHPYSFLYPESGTVNRIDPLDISDLLASLVERSMVVFDAASGRYNLSESMRAFATEQCAPQEAEAAKQKHTVGLGARYFVDETSTIDLRGGHSWIQQDASSIPNVPVPPVAVPPQMNFTAWTVSTAANVRF